MLNEEITWVAALQSIFFAPKSITSALKQFIIVCAFASPIALYSISYKFAEQASGALPPMVELIKSAGYFEVKTKHQKYSGSTYSVFHSNSGRDYTIENQFQFENQEKWIMRNPKKAVYLEGFFLQNGKGSFFATYVKPAGEMPILVPDEAMAYLNMQRDYKIHLPPLFFCIFAVIFSVFLIYKEKNNLSSNR